MGVLWMLWALIRALCSTQAALAAENLVLRQLLAGDRVVGSSLLGSHVPVTGAFDHRALDQHLGQCRRAAHHARLVGPPITRAIRHDIPHFCARVLATWGVSRLIQKDAVGFGSASLAMVSEPLIGADAATRPF